MNNVISDNRFLKVLITAQRAKQIHKGARPLVQKSDTRATRIALEEVERGLISFEFIPQNQDLKSVRDSRDVREVMMMEKSMEKRRSAICLKFVICRTTRRLKLSLFNSSGAGSERAGITRLSGVSDSGKERDGGVQKSIKAQGLSFGWGAKQTTGRFWPNLDARNNPANC